MKKKDFVKGFKYLAFIGYKWIECEYGKNGFSKTQLKDAIKRKMVIPIR